MEKQLFIFWLHKLDQFTVDLSAKILEKYTVNYVFDQTRETVSRSTIKGYVDGMKQFLERNAIINLI